MTTSLDRTRTERCTRPSGEPSCPPAFFLWENVRIMHTEFLRTLQKAFPLSDLNERIFALARQDIHGFFLLSCWNESRISTIAESFRDMRSYTDLHVFASRERISFPS